jgi:hypothetical protein
LGDARRNACWNAVIALTFHFASSDTVAHRVADATGWVASAWPLGRESFFNELLVETSQRVDDPEVRATLGGLPSSGQTGRLVRINVAQGQAYLVASRVQEDKVH